MVELPPKFIEKQIARYRHEVVESMYSKSAEPQKIITISREEGSDGDRVARALGEKLNIPVWDKEILDVLSSKSQGNYRAAMFEALDEKKQNVIDTLVANFFGDAEKDTYYHLLPKAIYMIAQHHAVIIGRGAHLLLPNSFRVRIRASYDTKIRTLIKREGMDEKSARQLVKQVDRDRELFLREMKGIVHVASSSLEFDIGINTDRLNVDESVEIIMHAFTIFRKKQLAGRD